MSYCKDSAGRELQVDSGAQQWPHQVDFLPLVTASPGSNMATTAPSILCTQNRFQKQEGKRQQRWWAGTPWYIFLSSFFSFYNREKSSPEAPRIVSIFSHGLGGVT